MCTRVTKVGEEMGHTIMVKKGVDITKEWRGGGGGDVDRQCLEGATRAHVLQSLGNIGWDFVHLLRDVALLLCVQGVEHLAEVPVNHVLGGEWAHFHEIFAQESKS